MFEARTHLECTDNLYFGFESEDERECNLTVGKIYFPSETSDGHVYIVNDVGKQAWYRDWRFKKAPKKAASEAAKLSKPFNFRSFNPYYNR